MQTQMAVVAEDGDGATRRGVVAEDEDEDPRNRAEADL
jgi:hypothetical protein